MDYLLSLLNDLFMEILIWDLKPPKLTSREIELIKINLENSKMESKLNMIQQDYVYLKEKLKKVNKSYVILNNVLKQKDEQCRNALLMIDQQKELIVEKDSKIEELVDLVHKYENQRDVYDINVRMYETTLEEYKKQLTLNYKEQQLAINTLKEQSKQINLLTRKNKELVNEVAYLKVQLNKKTD